VKWLKRLFKRKKKVYMKYNLGDSTPPRPLPRANLTEQDRQDWIDYFKKAMSQPAEKK